MTLYKIVVQTPGKTYRSHTRHHRATLTRSVSYLSLRPARRHVGWDRRQTFGICYFKPQTDI